MSHNSANIDLPELYCRVRNVPFAIAQPPYKRISKIGLPGLKTASEVKTDAAGEIGDPNLLCDQVSRYLY